MKLSEGYPNNLGAVFRKEYTDLRDSTVKDFENYTGMSVNAQREIALDNGSVIMFRHLEELNNIQNINLGWFWIEQAEELDTDDCFFTLFGRLRRKDCQQSGFITANTRGHNWIYKLWKCGDLTETVKKLMREQPEMFPDKNFQIAELVEAKTHDFRDIHTPGFIMGLEVMREKKPRLYARFVKNSWDEEDTVDIIIQPDWVRKSVDRNLNIVPPIRRAISIDVARYGDDRTTLIAIENNRFLAKEVYEKKNTMETVGRAVLFGQKMKTNSFVVDEIGVGAGVGDRLMEIEGNEVVLVNSSKSSAFPEKYYNLRSEIHGCAAELFCDDKVSIPANEEELMQELSWAKYKSIKSSGLLQVQAKEDIKKDYKRSPDLADAFMNGLWALPSVRPVKRQDAYSGNRKSYGYNSETC